MAFIAVLVGFSYCLPLNFTAECLLVLVLVLYSVWCMVCVCVLHCIVLYFILCREHGVAECAVGAAAFGFRLAISTFGDFGDLWLHNTLHI